MLSEKSGHLLTVNKCNHRESTSLLQAACFGTSQALLPCTQLKLIMFTGLVPCMQAAELVDAFNSSNQQLTLFAPLDIDFQMPTPQVVLCTLTPPHPAACCSCTSTRVSSSQQAQEQRGTWGFNKNTSELELSFLIGLHSVMSSLPLRRFGFACVDNGEV